MGWTFIATGVEDVIGESGHFCRSFHLAASPWGGDASFWG